MAELGVGERMTSTKNKEYFPPLPMFKVTMTDNSPIFPPTIIKCISEIWL